MNISRNEQRALHVLALGGHILHERDDGPKITSVTCVTREGMILADFDATVFERLRRKRLIESRSGSPYRISRRGRVSVRAQLDNQGGSSC
ncbi:YjhX family toxin [Pinisolibacter aquiterrae]|uniref:YjhX family toxin n=1 Tax=Pinisolibacter aquiterrae TaxID=2815579 RepID=UPI001C3D61EE|nr:YjhX family toxin [Pinisolibacter aquiterrae]MBV5266320.1 YjhX family toxin [Pinisolibacter aquiterrae]MCC8236467.1 YjhX family toxin [Pinisolibacter aquiterrae]